MKKDFDGWNHNKKETDGIDAWKVFYEREVWWCVMGVNVGVEIDGKHELFLRPVIILRKFNKDMALVVPTTTQDKEGRYYLDVFEVNGKSYTACISQVKAISAKRLFRKIGMIEKASYAHLITSVAMMVMGDQKNNNTSA